MASLVISLNLTLLTGEGAKDLVKFDAKTWLGRLGSSLSTYAKTISKGRGFGRLSEYRKGVASRRDEHLKSR